VSQTFQRLANVGLGSVRFRLIKQGQHPETTLIFTTPFLIYLHHPRACSIIPRIGLASPRAPNRVGRTNLSAIDEEFSCAPKGTLARCLGLFEQWPHLQLACLLRGCEVFIQAQLGPRQAFTLSQCNLVILIHHELEQHCVEAHAHCQGGSPRSNKPLSCGDNDLGRQLHLAL
jgi:hypothetical protein